MIKEILAWLFSDEGSKRRRRISQPEIAGLAKKTREVLKVYYAALETRTSHSRAAASTQARSNRLAPPGHGTLIAGVATTTTMTAAAAAAAATSEVETINNQNSHDKNQGALR